MVVDGLAIYTGGEFTFQLYDNAQVGISTFHAAPAPSMWVRRGLGG